MGRRLDDPVGDAAGEALIGLARRRDRSIRAKVRALLETENVGNLIVEAAGQLADSSLVPSLERLKGSGRAKDDPRGWLLDEALTACREGRPLERRQHVDRRQARAGDPARHALVVNRLAFTASSRRPMTTTTH